MVFLGWCAFAGGIMTALLGSMGATAFGLWPSLEIAILGLTLVAVGEIIRATVDIADHTRKILYLIREKNWDLLGIQSIIGTK